MSTNRQPHRHTTQNSTHQTTNNNTHLNQHRHISLHLHFSLLASAPVTRYLQVSPRPVQFVIESIYTIYIYMGHVWSGWYVSVGVVFFVIRRCSAMCLSLTGWPLDCWWVEQPVEQQPVFAIEWNVLNVVCTALRARVCSIDRCTNTEEALYSIHLAFTIQRTTKFRKQIYFPVHFYPFIMRCAAPLTRYCCCCFLIENWLVNLACFVIYTIYVHTIYTFHMNWKVLRRKFSWWTLIWAREISDLDRTLLICWTSQQSFTFLRSFGSFFFTTF